MRDSGNQGCKKGGIQGIRDAGKEEFRRWDAIFGSEMAWQWPELA